MLIIRIMQFITYKKKHYIGYIPVSFILFTFIHHHSLLFYNRCNQLLVTNTRFVCGITFVLIFVGVSIWWIVIEYTKGNEVLNKSFDKTVVIWGVSWVLMSSISQKTLYLNVLSCWSVNGSNSGTKLSRNDLIIAVLVVYFSFEEQSLVVFAWR